ncbi:GroES-like protein [Acaromyces ingoldii]|uniref:GroES-like protein n=1 Tax=Acaromyces ingoldii TaxID=215250 RepID=A0A316YKJ3_9BASI|nr:GroES-like protein [Acaromyces ingoldii]PWN89731.1 GroES-like protein [Acaromyces ingoldii]
MSAVRATHEHGLQLVAAPPRQAPHQGEVLIRNIYVASNPKDWKLSEWNLFEGIEGSDVAGIVEAVGHGVADLRHGDRVIACTPSATSDRCGAYQPFSIAPEHLVARIPPALSLEEAATLPLCFATASVAVHGVLRVAVSHQTRPKILVNGVGSSIGFYAAQLARHAGLDVHAIVRSAFSAAKARAAGIDNVYIFDDDVLQLELARLDFAYAFDAVSTPATVRWLCGVLATSASCTFSVLAGGVLDDVAALARANCPPHVDVRTTNAGATSQTPDSPYAETVRHWLSQAGALVLAGKIQTQPRQVLAGGLARVPDGLCLLREGRAGSKKLVYQVGSVHG